MQPGAGKAEVEVRRLTGADAEAWAAQRQALWPDCPPEQSATEMAAIVADARQVAFGAFDGPRLIGFVELSLHPHAIGCGPGPVAYLEGWHVDAGRRRTGIGARLVAAGEAWGRAQGCREIASDTWIDNTGSDAAHRALGFEETDRLIHYRRPLGR